MCELSVIVEFLPLVSNLLWLLCSYCQETSTEYSHLDPLKPPGPHPQGEELEEDIYADLGDIDGNDLMQFAYQIATGMVSHGRAISLSNKQSCCCFLSLLSGVKI